MCLGSTSSRRSSGSCWRRQRRRSAMATARLASFGPMMKRSSSETISRGVKKEDSFSSLTTFAGSAMARSAAARQALDGDVLVGVDADVAGDLNGFARQLLGVQAVDLAQRARPRQDAAATAPEPQQPRPPPPPL